MHGPTRALGVVVNGDVPDHRKKREQVMRKNIKKLSLNRATVRGMAEVSGGVINFTNTCKCNQTEHCYSLVETYCAPCRTYDNVCYSEANTLC